MPRERQKCDWKYLLVVVAFTIFGLIMLASASGPLGYQKFGDSYWFVRHQLLAGLAPGIIGFLLLWKLDYRLYKNHFKFFYILSVALLLLPFIPGLGNEYGTARSWINLAGFSFQTSELVKLTGLLALAGWLEARGATAVHDPKKGFLVFLTGFLLLAGLIALQPDIGSLSVIAIEMVAVYFMAGGSLSYIGTLLVMGMASLALLIKIKPYRADRFMVFLHPELDPQGAGYHINQALMTIGSGGLLGLGFGHSRQKFQYLPEAAGDSIFAVMAEELGLIFVLLLIGTFIYFLYRSMKIAKLASDDFGRYVVLGVGAWITGQAFINIASMAGLMPMTGLTLPFISFGGSSLFVILSAAGLVAQISAGHTRE